MPQQAACNEFIGRLMMYSRISQTPSWLRNVSALFLGNRADFFAGQAPDEKVWIRPSLRFFPFCFVSSTEFGLNLN